MASVSLKEKSRYKSVKFNDKDYARVSIKEKVDKNITINELLPFRIRITDIDIIGFSQNNAPPIPLQIIGLSNYIL